MSVLSPIRVSDSFKDQLELAAQQEGVTVSEFVRQAVTDRIQLISSRQAIVDQELTPAQIAGEQF